MNYIKRKIADWMFKHMTFPNGCEHGNEHAWILKGNCVLCVDQPLEALSASKYRKKYPVEYVIQIGSLKIYMCEHHLREFLKYVKEFNINE